MEIYTFSIHYVHFAHSFTPFVKDYYWADFLFSMSRSKKPIGFMTNINYRNVYFYLAYPMLNELQP